MRIDGLEIRNFKKFESQAFDFHPRFTLFVGENGSGKTSVLDALTVSLGIWLVKPPDSLVASSGRNILRTEVRLEAERKGDRVAFRERGPAAVRATGQIGDTPNVTWTRQFLEGATKTSNKEAKQALAIVQDVYRRDAAGENVLCPVLAYYGAGRAWLPSNQRISKESKLAGQARRWAAFYDCFNERIRFADVNQWVRREFLATANRKGRWRPGFEAMKHAVLACVPGANDLWFDPDRDQMVLSIDGNAQPLENLSAGQRVMLALVADIAIKAVTQNAYLLPPDELGPEDHPLPRVLAATPGVVLIDELDVHLHPGWQRRVATDLKKTFPAMQFVCTSHSPQVIGELSPAEIRVLDGEAPTVPERSFGIDSSRVLEELMGSPLLPSRFAGSDRIALRR